MTRIIQIAWPRRPPCRSKEPSRSSPAPTAALDALEAGEPEAVVDDLSRRVKAGLSDDQRTLYPQIEVDFAAMVGSRN